MSTPDLSPLVRISRLHLDRDLAALRAAAAACDDSRRHLADLDRTSASTGLPLATEAEVTLRYQRWAEARRREINLVLARQTAEWLDARDAARRSFGRVEVLDTLASRPR